MPPVIAAVAVWAAANATAILIASVVISAGTAIYGAAQARKAERAARNQMNEAMKDRMVTRVATEAPHRYIYGRAKVGADIVAMFTSGDKDQFRHLVCVHAAHECDAIEEVYVNNVAVGATDMDGDPTGGRWATTPDGAIAEEAHTGPTFTLARTPRAGSIWVFSGAGAQMEPVAITAQNGRSVTVAFTGPVLVTYEYRVVRKFSMEALVEPPAYQPVVRVLKHLGGASDTADAYLRSVLPDKWPATAVLRGMCYTVVTLDLNHSEFQSGLVPIHAVIRGRKLYDPRDGQTRWSANPALAVMDYLTSPLCDVPMSDLPLAQFITAANVCDEALPTGGARYTINGTVTSDQDQKGVLEAMAQAMAGSLVATTWDVYAGKYIAPVASLTQEDIVGSLSVNPGVSDASVYNGVKGQYIGPENKYVQTDFTPYQNPTYREADGRDLYTNIDFPFTESLQRVTNLARIFTEDQRNGFTIKAEFSLKAWPLKVGSRVTFTSKFLGQNAKVYRITDKSYAPNSAVQLTLKEDGESIWDYADATVLDSTPNTELPDPWMIDPPASISCTSGEATLLRQADGSTVPRILVTWPAMAQASGVQVEIEWRAVSSPTWERTTVSADETRAYLSPITPGYFYVVRARCVNPSLGARSISIATVYQVEVLTAAPTVYKWSTDKPAPPSGAAAYQWSTSTFGAAPSGWSLAQPAAPAGGNAMLWAATVRVSGISAASTDPFDWADAAVTSIGYAPSAAGTGPAGYSNARVFAYQRKATAPTGTPGAVTYDFTTGAITTASLANGWQKTIPAADGNPLYVTSASASAAGSTDTIASGEWSGAVVLAADGGAGAPGLNSATITLYQRSASATSPAKPSAAATYTFANGALAGLNNGWVTYIPTTGGAYLHTTFATAIAATATDTIAASEWATVQLMYDAADLIAAKAAADAANAAVAAIASDNVLAKGEKSQVIQELMVMHAEFDGINAQAVALGVNRDAYYTSMVDLNNYLVTIPTWNNVSVDTAIDGATFRARFTGYYTAKQALMNAIAAKSATVAQYDNVTGRPDVYRIVTHGGANTAPLPVGAGLYANGVLVANVFRSYWLVGIRRSDHMITHSAAYDVWGQGEATAGRGAANLAGDLNWFAANAGQYIVVLYSFDEPGLNRLTAGLPDAMYRNGASRAVFGSSQFQSRSAYALVAVSGCGEGNGSEAYQGAVPNDASAWIDVVFSLSKGNLVGVTAAYTPRTLRDYDFTGDMNATVGAPAGTNVAGVPAETVVAKANNAVAATPGFALNAYADSDIYGPANSTLAAGFSVNPTGYTGSYSVRWMLTSRSGRPSQGPFLSNASGNQTGVSATGTTGTVSFQITVIVTHSNGLTATETFQSSLTFGNL